VCRWCHVPPAAAGRQREPWVGATGPQGEGDILCIHAIRLHIVYCVGICRFRFPAGGCFLFCSCVGYYCRCPSPLGVSIGVPLVHRRAPRPSACPSPIGMHLVHRRAPPWSIGLPLVHRRERERGRARHRTKFASCRTARFVSALCSCLCPLSLLAVSVVGICLFFKPAND
jgi:hypothetical protein